jgi:hypothetical protein
MEMPLADVYDRISILTLKAMHGADVKEEMEYFLRDGFYIDTNFMELLKINYKIWQLESAIRNGKDELPLEVIGMRAIEIRNWNRCRVEIKNRIAKEEGLFEERKIDHASASGHNVSNVSD